VLGTVALTNKLTRIMFIHIKQLLPEIAKEIRTRMLELEERLKELGPTLPLEEKDKIHLLWNMVQDFCTIYNNTISGRYDPLRRLTGKNKTELTGGAKVKLHFYQLYKEFGSKYSATSEYSDYDIEKAIIMHEGDTIPGFPSVDVFVYLITPPLELLREPALDCL
jgi:hypothetical protein